MTPQLSLFDARSTVAPVHRMARRTDPETSRKAAESYVASGRHESHKMRVLRAVVAVPGSTFREIARACSIEPHAVMKRLADLRREKLVVSPETAHRKCGVSNETCQAWWATVRGMDLVEAAS